jgi:hypothetical protein
MWAKYRSPMRPSASALSTWTIVPEVFFGVSLTSKNTGDGERSGRNQKRGGSGKRPLNVRQERRTRTAPVNFFLQDITGFMALR